MLKIKPDINLVILEEKYGFKKAQEPDNPHFLYKYEDKDNTYGYGYNQGDIVVTKDRFIFVRDIISYEDMQDCYGDLLNPLFDMIRDNTIEKVN